MKNEKKLRTRKNIEKKILFRRGLFENLNGKLAFFNL